jgi:anti-sigma regulatory factor (Ser/Thr protein kinase)
MAGAAHNCAAQARWGPEPAAAGQARRFLLDRLRAWHALELAEDAAVVVSELVTNAVLHARTSVTVAARLESAVLTLSVHDDGHGLIVEPRPPRDDLLRDLDALNLGLDTGDVTILDPRDARLVAGVAGPVEAGRGLHLVEALADDWGVELVEGDGKTVWATLHDRATPPAVAGHVAVAT